MAKRKAIIFGTGSFAEIVDFYLTNDSIYDVVAFSDTEAKSNQVFNRPLVPFDAVVDLYPPDEHDIFIAVGYRKLNSIREYFCNQARLKGYKLIKYLSSRATHWGDTIVGDNTFIFENNTIQPFVTIGDGTILWSGNHVGHHSKIGSYCFVTSHAVISGLCTIGDRCFIGVNATISENISIGSDVLIGPGSLIQKNTSNGEAYLAERTQKYPKDSSRFFR